jgi:hypothetical protein
MAASVRLNLTGDEVLARETVMRPIAHPYDDALPAPAEVRCYSFEELFAEKLRAMGERSRPRDLYDIVNLYRRPDLRLRGEEIRVVLIEKCESKGVSVPSFASIETSEFIVELESEWENMLGHQLPALPPFGQFWGELAALFDWLEGPRCRGATRAGGGRTRRGRVVDAATDGHYLARRGAARGDPLRGGQPSLRGARVPGQDPGDRAVFPAAHPRRQSGPSRPPGRHARASLVSG